MDHDYINEHGVVSLYVAGKLSPDERIAFEEHFLDCRQCLEQIETTGDLRAALKQVATEDGGQPAATRQGVSPQPARTPWTVFGVWQRPGLLAYASLIVLLGLTTTFVTSTRHRDSEVAEARRVSEDWQRRYTDERQAREALQKQLGQSSVKTGDQDALVASLQPAPLFFLNVTRGSDQDGSPENHIAVPSTSPSIALSLEFERDPAFRSYRARLSDAHGRAIWSAENIPPPSGAIAITLPSRLLSKGNYTVAVEGLTSTGRYLPAAHFSFQATPQK
jgi:hypothetical protein